MCSELKTVDHHSNIRMHARRSETLSEIDTPPLSPLCVFNLLGILRMEHHPDRDIVNPGLMTQNQFSTADLLPFLDCSISSLSLESSTFSASGLCAAHPHLGESGSAETCKNILAASKKLPPASVLLLEAY
jgi:hypothetical protein